MILMQNEKAAIESEITELTRQIDEFERLSLQYQKKANHLIKKRTSLLIKKHEELGREATNEQKGR